MCSFDLFGDTFAEYENILMMPHDFIFNRDWYERFDGRGEFDDFGAAFSKLGAGERSELAELLSSTDPRNFARLPELATTSSLRSVLRFYEPKPKDELLAIWAKQKILLRGEDPADLGLAEDERVEDAGLEYDEMGEMASNTADRGVAADLRVSA